MRNGACTAGGAGLVWCWHCRLPSAGGLAVWVLCPRQTWLWGFAVYFPTSHNHPALSGAILWVCTVFGIYMCMRSGFFSSTNPATHATPLPGRDGAGLGISTAWTMYVPFAV